MEDPQAPNKTKWDEFMELCTPEQRKAFVRGMSDQLNHIIAKNLRKARERARKFKEEINKK